MKKQKLYKTRNIIDLRDMLRQSEQLFGDKNAFIVKDEKEDHRGITYSQFKSDVDAFGTALLDLGLKDKFIAVIGENRYEWCVTYISVVNGVGVITPLDKELPPNEIENLLTRSGASAVVFSQKFADEMKRIAKTLPSVQYFINMDIEDDEQDVLSFKRLVEKGKALIAQGDRTYLDCEIDAERISILLFTSGTTGLAKGVMLSHKNICSNIVAVRSTVYVDENDSVLSILPLHHTYECTIGFLTIIYCGGSIAFNEGLKYIVKNLKEYKPTILVVVPLILENMYKKVWEQARKKRGMTTKLKVALSTSNLLYKSLKIDIRRRLFKQIHENIGGRVRLFVTGAAAIDPEVSRGFGKMGIRAVQGYGLTETSPLVAGNRDTICVDGSVGLPIPGVSMKIDNPNENGVGEIIVKGDNVMLGYFEDEEATKQVLKDGWFYTGDLGYVDKDGIYYIAGRSKNVIVTKNGKNIFPEEVEAYINRSPFVQESLVWGKYDEDSGETYVNAQIFPNIDAIKEKLSVTNISIDELMRFFKDIIRNVNKNMPMYKRIRQFTIRENEFVKTTTRKIKRYMEESYVGKKDSVATDKN